MDFAASLMQERDYFRAVTVYKEVAFFEGEPRLRLDARYQIGRAYRLAGRYPLSLRGYAAWLSAGGEGSDRAGLVYAGMAASLLGMKRGAQATYYLDLAEAEGELAIASLYRGALALEGNDWPLARSYLERTVEADPKGPGAALAHDMMMAADRAENATTRSPALAGLLSTVVPGAGQAYSGHYVDALQALGFVGLLGFTSLVAYRYEGSRDGGYPMTITAISLTGLFHVANIVGAVKTAEFYNRRQREIALDGVIPKALKLDF